MAEQPVLRIVARLYNDFTEKFGIPRQSGLVDSLRSTIVFEPEYRNADALRGLEGFSHLWLLWQFSEALRDGWSPTVRPPRLGGNRRIGVFASRSPFRPNPIGLSAVKLLRVEESEQEGHVLIVAGADLLDGTPIFDIKPYLPFADCIEDAAGGYADAVKDHRLEVAIAYELLQKLPADKRQAAIDCIADDPRPSYQDDPARVYHMSFAGFDIAFTVSDGRADVTAVEKEI